jgi:hypothetical protein
MAVQPSNAPSLTAQDTFDASKEYKKSRTVRGAIVFDTDLNDAQDYLEYSFHRGDEVLNGAGDRAPGAAVPRQFSIVPLTREDGGVSEGMADRNTYNFGVTPGLLPSRLGTVDNRHLLGATFQPTVIFDYKEVVDQAATAAHDQVYSNYMFKGKITSGGIGETAIVTDLNKKFLASHRLLGTVNETAGMKTTLISGDTKAHEDDSSIAVAAIDDHEFRIREPVCRVVFTSGANIGLERDLNALLSETSLGFSPVLPNPLALDDTYVIIPGNALRSLKSNYDSANAGESPLLGLSSSYWFTTIYVHVWEEDISADEDDDLRKVAIDRETVHAVQLRWCVRTAEYLMSTDVDTSRAGLRESHITELLRSLNSEPHMWPVGAGSAKAAGNLEDNRHFPTQIPLVDQVSGDAEFKFGDKSYWTQTQGITALQIRMAARSVASHQNGARSFIPILGLEMRHALLGGDDMDIIPLMLFSPPSKPRNASELSDKFYPGAFIPQLIVGGFTGANAMPMIPLNYVRPSIYGDPTNTYFSVIKPYVVVPDQQWLDLPRISTDLMRAMCFSRGTNTGEENILRVAETVSGDIPLVYESLASRLSQIETALVGALGLGHQLGRAFNGGYEEDSQNEGRIGSSKNWIPSAADESIAQAGQTNKTFVFNTSYQLNPSAKTQGAVSAVDPLAGDTGWTTANAAMGGTFVPGPGLYRTRGDAGTAIEAGDEDGWSFYKYLHSGLVKSGEPEANFGLRKWEDGAAQAVLAREALNFRKLAIKTQGFITADLFTYDVQPAWKTNQMETAGPSAVPFHWTVDKHTGLGGVDPLDSMTPSAMAPFLDASQDQDLAAVHRTGFDSYGVGALPDAADLLPVSSAWRNYGQTLPLSQGTAPGARNIMWAEKPAAVWENASANVKADLSRGAWGRFEADEADVVNMLDTWANRCTAARLRYHVGDFYPGPVTSEGQTVNALVDTLNLYVRLEPLPLTHWATMPKHTHSALRESMRALAGMKSLSAILETTADTTELMDSSNRPLRTAYSPGTPFEAQDEAETSDASVDVGDVDWRDDPFPSGFQPFVHWYHPNMDLLAGPHPASGQAPAGGPLGTSPSGKSWSMYQKWGERSLIIPSITYNPDPMDVGTGVTTVASPPPATNAFDGDGTSDNREEEAAGQQALDDVYIESDKLGSHHNTEMELVGGLDGTITLRDSTVVTINKDQAAFPFIPGPASDATQAEHFKMGIPGPTFIPAFRAQLGGITTITDMIFDGTHPVMLNYDANAPTWEYSYFPQADRLADQGNFDDEAGATPFPWGLGAKTYGRTLNAGGQSAFDWNVPVLRSHIRTTTVAMIHALFKGVSTFTDPTAPVHTDADTIAASLVDSPTDLGFIGDMGCSVMLDSGGDQARTFYVNPLVYSMPHRKDGAVAKRGEATFNSDYNARHDAFQSAQDDADAAYADSSDAGWLPIMNTFKALYNAGLQQKLLFNSSLRVQHVRPGGGYRDGSSGDLRSTNPKSLTELFLVRDRLNGAAVNWPNGPTSPEDKPFLHLFSMHPSCAGGSGFSAHPNYAYISHLYPMVADGLGSAFDGVAASGDDLSDSSETTDTGLYAAEFATQQVATAVQGESYAADAFDIHYADALHAANPATPVKIAYSDRLQQNSGVEIDLVSELRYVRDNAAAHGLNRTGAGGSRTWLDLMPTVEDLTDPGDHEIVFTLYTGKYGHKMINDAVPDGYNPAFAGLRLVAEIHLNRPNEKAPSDGSGTGNHYGLGLETHHVLGHS